MKILFINKDDNRGGAAGVAWNLALELRKMGHEVRFIVRRKFTIDKDVYELKENLLLGGMRKVFRRDFTVVLSNIRDQILANDIDYGIDLSEHPWIKWADVIHCHNVHGNYFKLESLIKITRVKPVVWTLHDLWGITGHCAQPFTCTRFKNGCGVCPRLDTYQKMYWDNTKYLIKKKQDIYENSKMSVVVPSSWMESRIKESILKNKKCSVIHNSIDTKMFNNVKKINPVNKTILFFTYGWHNEDKGWKYIESALQKVKNVNFVGIGASSDYQDKNVRYVKSIYNQKTLADYYRKADLLLFPSLAESFGMVPLEAIACGTPVVAFPVGIIPELIDHKKNGYISKYADEEDLLTGINYTLNNALEVESIDKSYTIETMAKSYLKLYEENK